MKEISKGRRLGGSERADVARQLLAEYYGGASIRTLAARHGISIGRVRTLLVEAGVAFRPRGGRSRGA